MSRFTRFASAAALPVLLLTIGCPKPPDADPPNGAQPIEISLLYTSDEHGWILPHVDEGVRRGGVSQLLTMLVHDEHHCAGAFEGPQPDCTGSNTILMSGGDNFTGPAISTFFEGTTMAQCIRRLGYAVSAFGNHEFDFGIGRFEKNRDTVAHPYLAANLTRTDGQPNTFTQPYEIVERRGTRIAIVGLATVETPKAAAAHRFRNLEFADEEKTLEWVIPEIWKQDVDAIALIGHRCHDDIAPMVMRHPEWRLSFAGSGHCHRTSVELIGGVPVIGPDWRLEHYARITLHIDKTKPVMKRATTVGYELVEVASYAKDPEPSIDDELVAKIDTWQRRVDDELGEVIGYSQTGLPKKSAPLGQWLVRAWRERFQTDLAITTQGAIRQELPAGPITLATIYSIMPFENDLVLCKVKGSALAKMLQDPEAIVAGLTHLDGSWQHTDGSPLDPERVYSVLTTDFLYWGGDGYAFDAADPSAENTEIGWREPVIAWTRKTASSRTKPLEAVLIGHNATD